MPYYIPENQRHRTEDYIRECKAENDAFLAATTKRLAEMKRADPDTTWEEAVMGFRWK